MKYEIVVRRRNDEYFESEGKVWESEDSAERDSEVTRHPHYSATSARGIDLCAADLRAAAARRGWSD